MTLLKGKGSVTTDKDTDKAKADYHNRFFNEHKSDRGGSELVVT